MARGSSFFSFLAFVFFVWASITALADGQAWSLSDDQRRQLLRYYAPLLFKRADESSGRRGYDWLTNFDFDNDRDFSNNKKNWEDLNSFINGSSHSDWNIRPTMYTSMIEYMTEDGTQKEATLLYHVYHAEQDRSIHDWERIEVRLIGITGDPGSGETAAYVVVTERHEHKIRHHGHEDLNFMGTRSGSHPMIWQAEQRMERNISGNMTGLYMGELHFVEDSFDDIANEVVADDKAEVDVNGDDEKNVHYLFVPQDDSEAVSFWSAQTLTQSNASELQHGKDRGWLPYSDVARIKYELQDLADIFPTHWSGGRYSVHWGTKSYRGIESSRRVYFEEPLAGGIDGGPSVPTGLQTFYTRPLDDEEEDEDYGEDYGKDRNGYPTKSWFWGFYRLDGGGGTSEAYSDPERVEANGDPDSREKRYFRQHDFYSHDGTEGGGRWLPRGWHLEENGGFDGRWAQLF